MHFSFEIIRLFKNLTKDAQVAKYMTQFQTFVGQLGISTEKTKKAPVVSISLNKKKDTELGEEGYTLTIDSEKISLAANKAGGVFNGLQTLKQLLPVASAQGQTKLDKPISIKGCIIKDYPRFAWRGLMLDVSRHFFSVDEVKQYIDKMSEYKFFRARGGGKCMKNLKSVYV